MKAELQAAVWLILLFYTTQLWCQAPELNMMSDAFDDQYIGCEDEMEREMAKILSEERKYNQLDVMWRKAANNWSRGKLQLPASFKDEYGVAVVLYTMEYPYPIYQQLNRNVSIAGRSRDYYMNSFHFKALHFYLTRALQVLRQSNPGCFITYRGSRLAYTVSPPLRFGQFASSSKHKGIAAGFGQETFFTIFTCFGVDINELSAFEEQEVLIPVGEKFSNVKKSGYTYTLESTGEMCSYFNCAYLGGEKRTSPVCSSGWFLNSGSGVLVVGLNVAILLLLH